MKPYRTPKIAWGIAIAFLLAYEAWALCNKAEGDTLSEAVWDVAQWPIVPLLAGILVGHFFWQRKQK